jgi:hypothetical protein
LRKFQLRKWWENNTCSDHKLTSENSQKTHHILEYLQLIFSHVFWCILWPLDSQTTGNIYHFPTMFWLQKMLIKYIHFWQLSGLDFCGTCKMIGDIGMDAESNPTLQTSGILGDGSCAGQT